MTLTATVVVPVHNGAATLGDALEALLAQRTGVDAEIVVVDNNSTDGSGDIARQAGVTVLEEPTPGPSAARNRGLRHASGDVIVHVDADVLPTRRWLGEMLRAFEDDEVVLAAGRTVSHRPTTPAERYISASALYETELTIRRPPIPFAASLNLAVRRDAAVAVGGWAEEMRAGEDIDFCHRVRTRYPSDIAYRPAAVAMHCDRSTDERLRDRAWLYGEGVGHVYRRYPDLVGWGPRSVARVASQLAARATTPIVSAAGRRLGRVTDDQAEFDRYHRTWTWWFWRGFASMRRHGAYRPRPHR